MSGTGNDRPTQSLALRRIAIQRGRVFGLIGAVAGGAYLLLAGVLLLSTGKPIYVFQLVLGFVLLAYGMWRVGEARRRLRAFEEENGPGAGPR